MGLMARLSALLRVMRRKKRPMEALRLLRRRPALLLGVSGFETALMLSGRVPSSARALAQIKTSALIGCPF
jgi:alkylhydroperoxidase family enzyme